MQGTSTVTEWDGIAANDIVKVDGMHGLYKFMSARLDGTTPLWFTIAYLKTSAKSRTGTRIVTPERVTRLSEKDQRAYNKDDG